MCEKGKVWWRDLYASRGNLVLWWTGILSFGLDLLCIILYDGILLEIIIFLLVSLLENCGMKIKPSGFCSRGCGYRIYIFHLNYTWMLFALSAFRIPAFTKCWTFELGLAGFYLLFSFFLSFSSFDVVLTGSHPPDRPWV